VAVVVVVVVVDEVAVDSVVAGVAVVVVVVDEAVGTTGVTVVAVVVVVVVAVGTTGGAGAFSCVAFCKIFCASAWDVLKLKDFMPSKAPSTGSLMSSPDVIGTGFFAPSIDHRVYSSLRDQFGLSVVLGVKSNTRRQ